MARRRYHRPVPITPSLPTSRWRLSRRPESRHIVVCGANQLTYQVVEELVTRHGESVTVIVPSRTGAWAPDLAALDGVRLVEAARLDSDAFRDAKLHQARSLALMHRDDVGNLHAALRAQEFNSELRMVVRMDNAGLSERVHELFADCTALSDAITAAPAFVAAALDRPAPVRLPGIPTLVVAPRREIAQDRVLCTLATDLHRSGGPLLLPDTDLPDDLVLATTNRPVPDPVARRHRLRELFRDGVRVRRSLAIVVAVLLGLIAIGVALRKLVLHQPLGFALYDSVMTVAGAGDPDPDISPLEQTIQVVTMICGVSLTPAITAALVDLVVRARLAAATWSPAVPRSGHVVVAGLGDVGYRVLRQLSDMGERVVAIESDERVPGVAFARRRGIPLIIGDATRDETLERANVATCRALVPITNDDVTNLEIGLNARAGRSDLKVVLRLFSADLAARVERNLGITTSRSVGYLAAPKFAAALVDRQVIDLIPLGRRALVLADILVAAGTGLDRLRIGDAREAGESRVIALRAGGRWRLRPPEDHPLQPGERVIVLATRTGLGRFLLSSEPYDAGD